MLTLLQTHKLPKHNIILIYGRKYWDEVLNWKAMVRTGTISEDEYKLLQDAEAARNEVIAVDAFDPETFKNLH